MAKYKQRRRKLRARAKLLMNRKGDVSKLQCLNPLPQRLLDGLPPNPPHSQSSTFWPLALPSVKDAVRPLAMTASSLYWWCQNSVAQSFEVIKDTIFPSRLYLRQLNMLKQQVEKLEIEFSRLQGVIQIGLADPVSLPSAGVLQPASAPPPPPPPPPLPPRPPPPAPILLKRGNSTKALQATSVKDGPIQITLKDLLNVKLKNTQNYTKTNQAGSPVKKHRALITVSDLQSINLRPKSKLLQAPSTNLLITPSKNQIDLRKHLKKVNIQRSPGGTPLTNKENMETGTGLTPIMTQALRRKFQMAHPKTPSPVRLHTASSFEEQN
ncbi:proline-rich protein 11 isoform X2 [Chelonia mydas]|uniref:proline-rich protein 11 isoform X2 n=1 Tax=Chelonia mydas TaxID=8469 RepID=UPI0018A1C2DA|nr:proline-rich protein 11 isoform X2 [Chelonia mydas]